MLPLPCFTVGMVCLLWIAISTQKQLFVDLSQLERFCVCMESLMILLICIWNGMCAQQLWCVKADPHRGQNVLSVCSFPKRTAWTHTWVTHRTDTTDELRHKLQLMLNSALLLPSRLNKIVLRGRNKKIGQRLWPLMVTLWHTIYYTCKLVR